MALVQAFRFLDLPAELRNRIYEYAFEGGTCYVKETAELSYTHYKNVAASLASPITTAYSIDDDKRAARASGILTINRQIYGEAKLTYYTLTKFNCTSEYAMLEWLRTIPKPGVAAITKLVYRKYINHCKGSAEALAAYHRRLRDILPCDCLFTVDLCAYESKIELEIWSRH